LSDDPVGCRPQRDAARAGRQGRAAGLGRGHGAGVSTNYVIPGRLVAPDPEPKNTDAGRTARPSGRLRQWPVAWVPGWRLRRAPDWRSFGVVPASIGRPTTAVLVDNEPGVLARVMGLFSGRGYNIESLTVAEVDRRDNLSRITVVTTGT